MDAELRRSAQQRLEAEANLAHAAGESEEVKARALAEAQARVASEQALAAAARSAPRRKTA